jgi:hypothetical protein
MKLGVSYIVFDGVELLEHSIKQIRDHVDWIQVIYQDRSWFGHPIPQEGMDTINRLKRSKLVDEVTNFTQFKVLPQGSHNAAKSFERRKRQLGLDTCLRRGCTHYLCMDVDEFYVTEEFKWAKQEIINRGYTATSVKYINYVNIPTLHRGADGATVPFICKINGSSKMSSAFFSKCDPTRGIVNGGSKNLMFPPSNIKMHHMETVRKNLNIKYLATTRSLFNRNKTSQLVSNIRSVNEETKDFSFDKIIYPKTPRLNLHKVENIFNIPWEEWNILK